MNENTNVPLTDGRYWDMFWSERSPWVTPKKVPNRLKRFLFEPPYQRLFWNHILPPALPSGSSNRMIELGSAPGSKLIEWKERFGYKVFGADISDLGLELQRKTLAGIGLDESRSIKGDFLSAEFRKSYENAFDVVYSGGLIEHFSEPSEAVQAHLDILRPGGYLVITIPNLLGFYRRFLPPETVATHNLEIMSLPKFRSLFDVSKIDHLYSGYYGGVDLGILYLDSTVWRHALPKLQLIINLIGRVVRIPEHHWTSPYLVYVGRNKH